MDFKKFLYNLKYKIFRIPYVMLIDLKNGEGHICFNVHKDWNDWNGLLHVEYTGLENTELFDRAFPIKNINSIYYFNNKKELDDAFESGRLRPDRRK